jgi:outer membrane lipoprotein carrier protein
MNYNILRIQALSLALVFSLNFYAAAQTAGSFGTGPASRAFKCSQASEQLSREQGNAILAKVQEGYSKIESLQGGFVQESYVAALDEGEESSGAMVFAKPGKMRWSYKAPRAQEVVIRDEELWMYQPDKGQVMIDSVGKVLMSALPVSFLMGLGNLTQDFELVSACNGKEGPILSLVPMDKTGREEALEGFVLLVDRDKNLPKGAKINSVGGNVTAILFENQQVNKSSVDSGRFVLEYPKGVDILDRRKTPGS